MASVLSKNWNSDENYWMLNPMIKSIKVFRDFHDNDKSKSKENSSKIMWAIAMLIDPNDQNPWRNLLYSDKEKFIASDFVQDKKFKWEDYRHLIDEYEMRCITIAERELIELEKKLIERARFIRDTPYSVDYMEEDENGRFKLVKGTAKQLDDLLLNTEKIYKNIENIKERITKETVASDFGGMTLSASDKGDI